MSSEQTIPWRREPPVFNLSILRLQLPIAPVSSLHGCDESRQTPIRIKRAAMMLPVALAALPPQKNVGAAPCPMGSSQTRGCQFLGANPLLTHVAGDSLLLQIDYLGTDHDFLSATRLFRDRPRFLICHRKSYLIDICILAHFTDCFSHCSANLLLVRRAYSRDFSTSFSSLCHFFS